MNEIKDYITAVDTAFNTIDEATTALEKGLPGVSDDVKYLKETIEALQNNPGPITPEDQELLTGAQSRVNALAARLAPLSAALTALDEATTRPEPPPA